MSFFSSWSRSRDDDDGDAGQDRTALWFAAASCAFLVAGGSFALPHVFKRGEQAATIVTPVPVSIVAGPTADMSPQKEVEAKLPIDEGRPLAATPAPGSREIAAAEQVPAAEPLARPQPQEAVGAEARFKPADGNQTAALSTEAEEPAVGAQPLPAQPLQAQTQDPAPIDPASPPAAATPVAPQDEASAGTSPEVGQAPSAGEPTPLEDVPPTAEAFASIAEGTRASVGELQAVMADAPATDAAASQAPGPDVASTSDTQEPDVVQSEAPPPQPRPVLKAHGKPFVIAVPASVRARGADTFQIGNDLYQLSSIAGLGVDTQCERELDGRCVFHPRGALKKAIIGATLSCKAIDLDASPKLVECVKTGQQAMPDVTGEVGGAASSEKLKPAAPGTTQAATGAGLF